MAGLCREGAHHVPDSLFPTPALLALCPWPLGVSRLEEAGRSSEVGRSFCDQCVREVDKGRTPTPKPILGR